MKVGDLVYLNHKEFYEHDEHIGVIVMMETYGDSDVISVWWSGGDMATYDPSELEVISESR